jgi:hypothetical protein
VAKYVVNPQYREPGLEGGTPGLVVGPNTYAPGDEVELDDALAASLPAGVVSPVTAAAEAPHAPEAATKAKP